MNPIDKLLNKITMYRLVIYVLVALAAVGSFYDLQDRLPTRPMDMFVSFFILAISTYVTDRIFSKIFKVPSNTESWLITCLILFLIVQPADSVPTALALGLAGAISSASKFLLARRGKHFFNPAALAAAFMSLWGFWPTTWWVGSSVFWPFTLVLGLLVIRKTRKFSLVLTFAATSIVLQAIIFIHGHDALGLNMKHFLTASPLLFLGTIMLTEPATMPPRRKLQMVYGALVAVFYVTAWKIGPVNVYPEVALLIGNVFAYVVSPKYRARLTLKQIQKYSDTVYNYIFKPETAFNFIPGQYMEWTLAGVPFDARGNRRTFTIASSPTEEDVRLGLKFYEPASTYKARLRELKPGDVIYASQLAGNFTMGGNENKKLAFVAGGIGITPFRSMAKYLTDKGIHCDIVLIYMVSDPSEFAYIKEFKEASKIGLKLVPVITSGDSKLQGAISAKPSSNLFQKLVPDYAERIFYISGPDQLVDATKKYLRQLGVHSTKIKTDHFSGY